MFYVVSARPAGGHRVWLRFEDGRSGTLDISKIVPFDGVFAPLSDPRYFRKLSVYGEGGGTIYWPNGADIDPEVLYSEVTQEPILWAGRTVYEPVGALIQSYPPSPGARKLTRPPGKAPVRPARAASRARR